MLTGMGNNINDVCGFRKITEKIKPLIIASFPKNALACPPADAWWAKLNADPRSNESKTVRAT